MCGSSKHLITDGGRECRICKAFKPWSEFHNCVSGPNKKQTVCKPCATAQASKYAAEHREATTKRKRAYRIANKEKISAYNRQYSATHKLSSRKKLLITATGRECTVCGEYKTKEHYNKHKYRLHGMNSRCRKCEIKISAQYRELNRDNVRKQQRERHAKRIATDPKYKLAHNIRSRLNKIIKTRSAIKSAQTLKLIGAPIDVVVDHIERQFTEEMSWELFGNYAALGNRALSIDHIRPIASFDLTDPEEQKKAFHYTNLQPMFLIDNIKKGSKYEL
jgi:hypothetical protein